MLLHAVCTQLLTPAGLLASPRSSVYELPGEQGSNMYMVWGGGTLVGRSPTVPDTRWERVPGSAQLGVHVWGRGVRNSQGGLGIV